VQHFLAVVLRQQERHQEAQELADKVLRGYRAVYPPDSMWLAANPVMRAFTS